MAAPDYRSSRFDAHDEEPIGPLANLADIMLVFAVGLMVALAAARGGLEDMSAGGVEVDRTEELPEVPEGAGAEGSGYESVGRVYQDPETGEMVLIGEDP